MDDHLETMPEDADQAMAVDTEEVTEPAWHGGGPAGYSAEEFAFAEIGHAIMAALTGEDALTRKQLRKRSGLKKKAFKLVEGMDENAPIGDVLRVLEAAGKTLAVVPLPVDEAENAAEHEATEP